MELKDLVGLHKLSGVDVIQEKVKHCVDCFEYDYENVVKFILDDITYKAVEDSQNGYRSYCGELIVCNEPIANNFLPQEVMVKMKDDEECSVNILFNLLMLLLVRLY